MDTQKPVSLDDIKKAFNSSNEFQAFEQTYKSLFDKLFIYEADGKFQTGIRYAMAIQSPRRFIDLGSYSHHAKQVIFRTMRDYPGNKLHVARTQQMNPPPWSKENPPRDVFVFEWFDGAETTDLLMRKEFWATRPIKDDPKIIEQPKLAAVESTEHKDEWEKREQERREAERLDVEAYMNELRKSLQ